jgi:hypothetical protein
VNNSEKTSTYLYRKENEYVMSLPRSVVAGGNRKYYPDSLLWLVSRKFNSLKIFKSYLIQVIIGWKWLAKTLELKKRGLLINAIVIGNGPSQGYLDLDTLAEFKKNGGELICINYWTDNTDLSKIVPTYLVSSDPVIFSEKVPDHLKEKNEKLLSYMLTNKSIVLACPLDRCEELSKVFGQERIIGFVDTELRFWSNNINPLFPRGYVSMTLYKALALANWFDYRNIYLIGMDNTYPRNIYCDQDNKYLNHEIHAGAKDFVSDMSLFYNSVADGLYDIAQLFYDARKFKNSKIINLDPYSLTDAFQKSKQSVDCISNVLSFEKN